MPKKQRERGRRGDGAVYPIKRNGKIVRYAAALDLGVIDGKRRRKVIYGATETEVSAELTKLRADMLRGIDIAPDKITVEQYLNAWLKSVELSKSAGTLRIYRNNIKHLIRYLGAYKLPALKAEHVEQMMTELRSAGLAEGTRKTIRAALVTALNQAVERGYITKNVAMLVEAPHVRRTKVRAFTEAQIGRLNLAARGHWLEYPIQVALRLGLRSGEVRGLLWSEIDYEAMTIRISGSMQKNDGTIARTSTKNESSDSTLPLPPGLAEVFRQQWKRQQAQREKAETWHEHGLVFTREDGGPIEGTLLANAFKVLAKKAELPPHATFHGLRHTCAALLIKRRAQPRQVMEVLRHKSIRTTMDTYGHLFPEVTRETVNDLDRDLDQLAAGGGQ